MKALKSILPITVALIALSLTYKIFSRVNRKVEFNQGLLSDDRIKLYSVPDSSLFHFGGNGNFTLIYFNSECDHCQREIKDIERNIDQFDNEKMIFFSSQSINEIASFRKHTALNECPNAYFEKINIDDLATVFGNPAQPTMFIYRDGKLIKELGGEIEISTILKFLK